MVRVLSGCVRGRAGAEAWLGHGAFEEASAVGVEFAVGADGGEDIWALQ